jgi:2-amino-4-hydroxy-6-hydroxymethyldihydropteridine diphosphokinase
VGDPRHNLRSALAQLNALPATELELIAPTYVSAPAYESDQEPFHNTVVTLKTQLGPLALFAELQALERVLGRVKVRVNGPRSIDLDLLAYDDETIDLPHLTVPHPRIAERAFVVQPLLDIAPVFRFSTGQQLRREAALLGAIMNSYPALKPAD